MTDNLNTDIDKELLVIMGAVYAGGAIDQQNSSDGRLELEKIPQDSKVLNGVAELQALIQKSNTEYAIKELEKCIEVAGESLYHGRAMAETKDDGSLTYGVEEKYFKDRIELLQAHTTKSKLEKGK